MIAGIILGVLLTSACYAIYLVVKILSKEEVVKQDAKVEILPKVEDEVRRKRGRPKGSKTLKRRYPRAKKGDRKGQVADKKP